ncbi:MAG: peptidoglycan bridge formation glycyltransferase FemA/FemB family protein [Bacteroidetes bacterium]|nr:peptidoglycan bridge formation glycyltransferase FemA/FemB family protein [Bacteroidota bacterium]
MKTIVNNPCLPGLIGNYYNYKYDEYGVWVGSKYVCLPFFSYGNINFKNKIKNYPKWEFRGFEPVSEYYTSTKITSYIKLDCDITHQFNQLGSNLKRKIKKALKNNIEIKSGGIELLKDYYLIYSKNMLKLGSPVLKIGFFNEIITKYSNGNAKIFVAYLNDKPIGSALLISYLGFYENCWFATLRKYNKLYTSYLLHWEMIKFAIENKARIYSFGRSNQNSSVLKYKQQWNTENITLYWSFSEKPKINIRKIHILRILWKALPLSIANLLGPVFAKNIYTLFIIFSLTF